MLTDRKLWTKNPQPTFRVLWPHRGGSCPQSRCACRLARTVQTRIDCEPGHARSSTTRKLPPPPRSRGSIAARVVRLAIIAIGESFWRVALSTYAIQHCGRLAARPCDWRGIMSDAYAWVLRYCLGVQPTCRRGLLAATLRRRGSSYHSPRRSRNAGEGVGSVQE
jgi:hypothetical protein